MAKTKQQEEMPRLTVYLPPEMEKAVYNDFRALAQHAIAEVTRNVVVNNRYLNQSQLIRFLGVGIDTIRKFEAGGLRYFNNGRQKIYDLNDVHEYIEKNKI